MEQTKLTELKKHAAAVRLGILDGTHAAASGHPGGSLSIADVITYLYFEEMNVTPRTHMLPTATDWCSQRVTPRPLFMRCWLKRDISRRRISSRSVRRILTFRGTPT